MRLMKIIIILLIIVAICLLSGWFINKLCNDFKQIRSDLESYLFDYDTIVRDIQSGKTTGLFQPYSYSEDSVQFQNSNEIPLTLEGYFLVAEAYHEEMWGESAEEWHIATMFFSSPCDKDVFTPSGALLEFERLSKKDSQKILSVSSISLWPLDAYGVYGMRDEYILEFNRNLGKKVSELKIFPWEALEIAERNGGAEYREIHGSSCWVSIRKIGNWEIRYFERASGDEGFEKDVYTFVVDDDTGELVEIIKEE